MRPYTLDFLPPRSKYVTGTAAARLTVVPVHLKDAMVSFLLDDGFDTKIRALFSGVDGVFELKFLGFTMREYLARLGKLHDEDVEKEKVMWQKMEAQNYYSGEEELSD